MQFNEINVHRKTKKYQSFPEEHIEILWRLCGPVYVSPKVYRQALIEKKVLKYTNVWSFKGIDKRAREAELIVDRAPGQIYRLASENFGWGFQISI